MPQKDLQSIVYGGNDDGDAKADAHGDPPAEDTPSAAPPDDPDFPPASFFVPIDDEADWVDTNAVYYDREDSTKGNTNPKSQHSHSATAASSKPPSNSLRFSGNLQQKVPIIGLPNAVQQYSGYLGRSKRCPTSSRIFPKKPPSAADRSRKSAVPDHEPSSPKVSCIGKVLTERERCRRHDHGESPEDKKSEAEPAAKAGCWASIAGAFRCCGGEVGRVKIARVQGVEDSPASSTSPSSETVAKSAKRPASPERAEATTATEPPALGAMKRFASGRKSATWEEELDLGAGSLRGAVDGGVGSAAGWVV